MIVQVPRLYSLGGKGEVQQTSFNRLCCSLADCSFFLGFVENVDCFNRFHPSLDV